MYRVKSGAVGTLSGFKSVSSHTSSMKTLHRDTFSGIDFIEEQNKEDLVSDDSDVTVKVAVGIGNERVREAKGSQDLRNSKVSWLPNANRSSSQIMYLS